MILYAAQRSDVPRMVNLSGRMDVRGGFLQRFGADTLARLEAEGAVARRDAWGEWELTLEVREGGAKGVAARRRCLGLRRCRRASHPPSSPPPPQDAKGRIDLPMEHLAASIPPSVELLIVHGTGDATIPFQESQRCAELVPRCRLELVKGGDHNFSQPAAAADMIARVVAFARQAADAGGAASGAAS